MTKILIEITNDSGLIFTPRKVTSRTHDCNRRTRSTRDREDRETGINQ